MKHETKRVMRIEALSRLSLVVLSIALAGAAGCGRSGAVAAPSSDAEAAPIAVKLIAA